MTGAPSALDVERKVRAGIRRDESGDWTCRVYLGTVRGRDGEPRQDRRQGSADGALPMDEAVARIVEQVMRRKVSELLGEYLDGIEPFRSPNTMRAYRGAARNHVLPALGNRPAAEVGVAEAQAFAASLAEPDLDGRSLAPATVRQTVAMLSGAWSRWLEDRLVPGNPWRAVVTAPPSPPAPDVLAGPELAAVASAIGAHLGRDDPDFGRAATCALMLDTGMRRGEACAVRWRDWDGQRMTVRVCGNVVDTSGSRPRHRRPWTKAGKARTVAVGDALADLIRSLPRGDPESPLLPDRDGRFQSPAGVARWLRRTCAEAGVRCHCHELRHTNATQLLWGGVDYKTVQARLGHASPATTLRIYAAALPDTDRATANALSDAIARAEREKETRQ